jgi:hypothetical protein
LWCTIATSTESILPGRNIRRLSFRPMEPKQLRVDGDDNRACRHHERPDGGRHLEPGAERDASCHGDGNGIITGRPDQILCTIFL